MNHREDVFKTESDLCEHMFVKKPQECENEEDDDVFEEFETCTQRQNNVDEIKQEIIECEEPIISHSDLSPKIDHDSLSKENVKFCHATNIKELENTKEVKETNISGCYPIIQRGDIKGDISEYVQYKAELLTTYFDLPTMKNENTEYQDCFEEWCSTKQQKWKFNLLENSANDVLVRKPRQYNQIYFPASKSSSNHIVKYFQNCLVCKFCGKLCEKGVLQKHLETHTIKKLFKCDICSKECKRKSYLEAHLKIHTNTQLNCNICSKKFNHKNNLRRHLITHTNEKPFNCNICFKGFKNKSHIRQHLIIHNEKPYKCDICSKKFKEKAHLQRHLMTYINKKSFKCDICYKRFHYECGLRKHLITHFDEISWTCNICLKEFTRKSNLLEHLTIHLTQTNKQLKKKKLFKCKICSKEFHDQFSLQKHVIIIHSNDKPFKCNICTKEFTLESNLERHLITHTY